MTRRPISHPVFLPRRWLKVSRKTKPGDAASSLSSEFEPNCGKSTARLQTLAASNIAGVIYNCTLKNKPANITEKIYSFFFIFFSFFCRTSRCKSYIFLFRSRRHGGRTKSQAVPCPSRWGLSYGDGDGNGDYPRWKLNHGVCHFFQEAAFYASKF